MPEQTEIEQLYEMLKRIQEPKGYYFNTDREKVMDLLDSLLKNKGRYGYMSCPCRLSSGIVKRTRISFAHACIGRTTSRISAPAIALCMFPKNGKMRKLPTKYVPERRPLELFFS